MANQLFMITEKRFLDRRKVEKNPDYYPVESNGEMFEMVKALLEETVYGQPEACTEVARAITRSISGLNDPNRPGYVGLFLGEPGVGKTEMGKAVAKIFDPIDYESRLKVVDCNMFQHSHDAERFLGAPPSYIGYGDETFITKNFLSQPNVIVFDEIEKANISLHRLLLRIMDKGRLDINESDDDLCSDEPPGLDFSQSIIILTSNIGSEAIRDIRMGKGALGFGTDGEATKNKDIQKVGVTEAKLFWKHMPEFLNRIDSMVVFNSLSEEVVYRLIDKFLAEYFTNQDQDATYIMATDQLKDWIVSHVDIKLAGRELRRMIERMIITPAAEVKIKMTKGVPLIADISQDDPKRVIFWVSKTMTGQH